MIETQNKNVPKLRFPEFMKEWVPAKAGQAFKNRRDRGEAGLPICSVTMGNGLVRRDSLDRQFGPDAADSSNLRASRGDLIYNMMRMWQGAVGQAIEECMVSPAYVVLSPLKNTSSDFFYAWFKSHRMLYKLWAYSQGLTSDRLRLYFDDFRQIPLHIPHLSEQKKIAAFLSMVNEKLKSLCHKRNLLNDYKRGVMQQIFSRQIRFKRNDGSDFPEWKKKRLGEVATFSKGKGISKSDTENGGNIPCIRYAELYTSYGQIIEKPISSTKEDGSGLELSQGGEVIVPASGETAKDIATFACVTQPGVAIGGDLNIIRPIEVDGRFLARYMSSHKRTKVAQLAQGNSVVHLYGSQLREIEIDIPCPDEQHKIDVFLSALDFKLDAVAAQINQIEAFKQGLLQQMFV